MSNKIGKVRQIKERPKPHDNVLISVVWQATPHTCKHIMSNTHIVQLYDD